MPNSLDLLDSRAHPQKKHAPDLAATITKASSRQTFYTIRFLVDRERVPDAYRAYAYFRWVDDCLDAETCALPDRNAFLKREQSLLEACYQGQTFAPVSAEEQLLVDLVGNDTEKDSGLQFYLRNMMAVMDFDVARRGRMISQAELSAYSRLLATAVTEALLYFIGHNCPAPCADSRYLAVHGAHVIHMLRDMREDAAVGYLNMPREYFAAHDIALQDVDHPAYRKWVFRRVKLACQYFRAGREYISQVSSLRCRLAGFAYIARFEWMVQAIQRNGYRLRTDYPERKSLRAGLWMAWRTLLSLSGWFKLNLYPEDRAVQPARIEER